MVSSSAAVSCSRAACSAEGAEALRGARWVTSHGLVVPVVSAETMAEVDRVAIEETGPNLFQMMENAGRSLAQVAMSSAGDTPVLVMAGKGGNGGGGICAARHLLNHGVDVVVHLVEMNGLGEVPRRQLEIYESAGGSVVALDAAAGADFGMVIDAVVGYSLHGTPRGRVAESIAAMNSSNATVLSLDVPSGVPTSGDATPGQHVKADITLTLALPKLGLEPSNAGDVALADLGIPAETFVRAGVANYPKGLFGTEFTVPISYEA